MKKLNKKRTIGIVAASLATVSLVSVGLSAWIITGNETATSGDITVTVGDVTDERIAIKNVSLTDASVSFDTNNAANAVLKSSDSQNHEDLSFSVSFDVVSKAAGMKVDVKAKIVDYSTASGVGKAVSDNYIVLPTNLGGESDVSVATTYTTGTTALSPAIDNYSYGVTVQNVTFTFAWGSKFNSQNPSSYATAENVDTVITDLKALKSLNPNTFKVILTPSVSTTSGS